TDCNTTGYCDLNTTLCVPKKIDGANCNGPNQCKSGFCEGSVCCNSSCHEAGQTCSQAGNVGKCQCVGVTCAAGVPCQVFYKDGDGDGNGNANGRTAAGTAKAGCQGDNPPAGFLVDHTDCDDADGRVNKGQTQYFDQPSNGIGTFDYNCSGGIDKQTYE